MDALIDLPFAMPTAVSSIALSAIYAGNGWIGQFFAPFGIKLAFNPVGIVIALTFIGLPFVVRTMQPVLKSMSVNWKKLQPVWVPVAGQRSAVSFFRPWCLQL